jgi:hypothetical protein
VFFPEVLAGEALAAEEVAVGSVVAVGASEAAALGSW